MTGYSHILNAQRGTRNIELGTRNSSNFKLINAVMSSTMTGYSHILNAERGTLNAELFKLFKLSNPSNSSNFQTLQTLQTTSSPVHFRPRYSRSFPHQPVGHNQSGK